MPEPDFRVGLIAAGGTIAMMGAHSFDWVDYADTGILRSAGEITASLAHGLGAIEVEPVDVAALPSTGVTPREWLALARKVHALLASDPGLDGLVVTHGTASLEETAFFLDLVHRHDRPVVLVGAQRPPNTASSDAVANLRAAVAAAAAPALRSVGAVVVMNNTIHAARDVTKMANHQLEAFRSPEFGPLGTVEADGSVRLHRISTRHPALIGLDPTIADLPRVDIALSYAGADGTAIDAFVDAGAKAIISAGFPPGRCTPAERQALIRARAAGVLVVQSSRATSGRVPVQSYNTAEGILAGGGLSPQKVRIAVMLKLAEGGTAASIQAVLLAA